MSSNPFSISWNTFTNGINDQKYQGQEGRYYRGFGVDTQKYDVSFPRTTKLVNTYSGNINAIFATDRIDSSNENILWTNDGKIYKDSTLMATIAGTAKQGYNIGYMKPIGSNYYKLYYFHFTSPAIAIKKIHRTNLDGSGFEEDYREYTSDSGNPFIGVPIAPSGGMIVLNEGNRIVFSYYNEIWEINNSEIVSKLVSFPSEQNVVGITEFQGDYKVYTTSGFSTSKVYKWDGLDSIPTTSVDLRGLAITGGVGNLGAYDYFIADSSFFLMAGLQYQKLYNSIGGKILTTYDDKVVLELEYDNKKIIAEYSDAPGYNKGIHPRYIVDIANQGNGIRAIDYTQNGLVFSSFSKLFNNYQSGTTGSITPFIESLVFIADNIQYEKSLDNLILKFSGFTTTNIILYIQTQESGTWIKLWEGNNNSVTATNHGIKIYKDMFLNPIGNFNTIRFRVEFPSDGSSSTRRFYGVDIFGNQNVGL